MTKPVMDETTTAPHRRATLILVVGLVVVASLGGVLATRAFVSSGDDLAPSNDCDRPIDVRLVVAPELKPQLETAAKSLDGPPSDGQRPCATFKIKVSQAAPSQVAEQLASGDPHRPDIWIPDSSLWVPRADDGDTTPTIAVPSITTTPLVLVGRTNAFATTASWLATFENAPPYLLDPQHTATGLAAFIALEAERLKTGASEAQVRNMLVPLAQMHGSLPEPYTDLEELFNKAAQDTDRRVVPAPEQAFLKYKREHPESPLQAKVPATGTLVLDYPIVVTAEDHRVKISEVAHLLARATATDEISQARDQAGFRDPAVHPLGGGRGVGTVNLLGPLQPKMAAAALNQWERYALATHALMVIDTSGSMAEKVGNRTRMELAIEAAETGLDLFPDSAQLGLWGFSTDMPGRTTDWHSQMPIRRLGDKVGGSRHRQLMLNALHGLPSKVGGGTGLYETAIGAYRAVQDSFDPTAINSVFIFTDGKNDAPNSPSLQETLMTLENLRDPARPVRLIAIGMGPDADATELKRLAEATGGQHYIARDPNEIREVFVNAAIGVR